jgi:hypothetical protein
MYTVIRQYEVGAGDEEDVNQLVMGDFGAALRAIPGFVNYTWIKGEGGIMFSIGVFTDRAGAEESNRVAAEMVRQRLEGKAIKRLAAMEGEVIYHQ